MLKRTFIGACVGYVCGLLVLAGFGTWAGFTLGGPGIGRPRVAPGWEAAFMGGLFCIVYGWWLALTIGGVIGGAAGLGSWLARPRRSVKSGLSGCQARPDRRS